MLLWHRILHEKGWIAPLWPKKYGGPGWSITQRFLFEQETSRAGTLPPLAFSVTMVGPVIYTFGNEAQKKQFLPRILTGEDLVVPGLLRAGLRLRPRLAAHQGGARRRPLRRQRPEDLDDARPSMPTGSSAWCAPTSERKPQAGISFLLIDMKTPGITVRPIITLDGGHEVNEVFFETCACRSKT